MITLVRFIVFAHIIIGLLGFAIYTNTFAAWALLVGLLVVKFRLYIKRAIGRLFTKITRTAFKKVGRGVAKKNSAVRRTA